MFAVRSIQVEGASPALAVEVRAELRSFDGRSLVAVNGDAVEQRVDDLAAVRASVVDRSFPHTLRIRVLPELPVAVLRRGPESWLVSARGRVIATIPLRTRHDLPRGARGAVTRRVRRQRLLRPDRIRARARRSDHPRTARWARDPVGRADRPASEDRDRAGHPSDVRAASRRGPGLSGHHRPRAPSRGPQPSTLRLTLTVLRVDTPVSGAYPAAKEALDSPNALVQLEVEPSSVS